MRHYVEPRRRLEQQLTDLKEHQEHIEACLIRFDKDLIMHAEEAVINQQQVEEYEQALKQLEDL